MSFSSPDPEASGTLVVELPHWAVKVRVSDDLYRLVMSIGPPKEDLSRPGHYQIEAELVPGVYQVQLKLMGETQSHWTSVRPDKKTRIKLEQWGQLKPMSAIPHEDPFAECAEALSRQSTWTAAPGGYARLFVFVRTPDPAKYARFAEGLSLLRDDETVLVDLANAGKSDARAGWMAFSGDLPPGYYILRRSRPGVHVRHQPIVMCAGWETQVFIGAGKKPSLRTMALSMAPFGQGFRRHDESANAADAVLRALHYEDAIDSVVEGSKLSTLLQSEHTNPWLGILACYALSAWEDAHRFDGPGESRQSHGLAQVGLREKVLGFLKRTVGAHPDVRALSLLPDVEPEEPFPHPPLMRAGLRRVKQNAMSFSKTVPVGSLTERVWKNIVANAPWTAWRNLDVEALAIDADAGRREAPDAPMVAVQTLAKALPPSALVFRPAQGAATEHRRAPSDLLGDVVLINAARSLTPSGDLSSMPNRVTIDFATEIDSLLSSADAVDVSHAMGMPRARVEDGLQRLRDDAIPSSAAAMAAQRAIVGSALRDSIGVPTPISVAADMPPGATDEAEGASGATVASTKAAAGDTLTIEESVTRLRAEALRLQTALPETTQASEITQRARRLATRLSSAADKLLEHADFVSITDAGGRLLYGNGAFAQIVSQRGGKKQHDATQWWENFIASQPAGASMLTNVVNDVPGTWNLQRTLLADESDGGTRAYLNILRPVVERTLAPNVLAQLEPLLNEITLHASFVAYGSEERRAKSMAVLDELSGKLEVIADGAIV